MFVRRPVEVTARDHLVLALPIPHNSAFPPEKSSLRVKNRRSSGVIQTRTALIRRIVRLC
jgi:hypothetical protein